MEKFNDSEETKKYLKEIAENEAGSAKPFPCPFLAVLKEEINILGSSYNEGDLLCYNKSAGFKRIGCSIGEYPIKPLIDETGTVSFIAKCSENKLAFTLEIQDTNKI